MVAGVLAGIVAIVGGWVALRLASRGRSLRPPTPTQLDDITKPLGRIAVRHLPMDALGPDFTDVLQAAAATNAYVLETDQDGHRKPLVSRTAVEKPLPTNPQES